jgi:predicted SnoaL-like aldol condensation-catalyzing enzyme
MSTYTERAIDFYKIAFNGNPRKATELFAGSVYKQHNPLVQDGIEGFIEYFEKMNSEYPDKSIDIVRAVSEGNMVALHTHQIWPGNEEYVTMDFFGFDENGKIVEHWDAVQKIPADSKNINKMY